LSDKVADFAESRKKTAAVEGGDETFSWYVSDGVHVLTMLGLLAVIHSSLIDEYNNTGIDSGFVM
jgi:hypothetical protein